MQHIGTWKYLLLLSVIVLGVVPCRGQQCTSEGIMRCLQPLEGANIHIRHGWLLQVAQWNVTIIREACNSTMPRVHQCLVLQQSSCSRIAFFGGMFGSMMKIYTNFLSHICTEETLTDISYHGECLNKPEVQEGADRCYLPLLNLLLVSRDRSEKTLDDLISLDLLKTIMWFGIDYFCGILNDIRVCNAGNVDRHCGPYSVYLVDGVFKDSIKSVAAHVQCNFEGSLGKYCLPNPCLNNGQCNHTISDQPVCICPPGFEGDKCERPTGNPCFPNPCLNGGRCNVTTNGTVCICLSGFTGQVCNQTLEPSQDKCSPNPCLNGGICYQTSVNQTLCVCPPEYEGDHCQTMKDLPKGPCTPNPCRNGGQCENTTSGDFNCTCPIRYHGQLCEFEGSGRGLCHPNPCQHGGVCEVTADRQVTCDCPVRYAGDRCHISKACRELMCENNGTCHDNDVSATCLCTERYTGRLCDVIIGTTTIKSQPINRTDGCSNITCHNGGVCQSGGLTPTCSCPGGFAGNLCEIKVEPGENAALNPDDGWSTALAIAAIFGVLGGLLLIAMTVTVIVYRRRKVSVAPPEGHDVDATSNVSGKKLSGFTWRLKKPADVEKPDVGEKAFQI